MVGRSFRAKCGVTPLQCWIPPAVVPLSLPNSPQYQQIHVLPHEGRVSLVSAERAGSFTCQTAADVFLSLRLGTADARRFPDCRGRPWPPVRCAPVMIKRPIILLPPFMRPLSNLQDLCRYFAQKPGCEGGQKCRVAYCFRFYCVRWLPGGLESQGCTQSQSRLGACRLAHGPPTRAKCGRVVVIDR